MSDPATECPPLIYKLTGMAIKEYLEQVKEGSPYDFYLCFKQIKPTTSYRNILKYFHYLKKLGLIRKVRVDRRSKRGFKKVYYSIVEGMEDAEEWFAPQGAIYPETLLGKRRYSPEKVAEIKKKRPTRRRIRRERRTASRRTARKPE